MTGNCAQIITFYSYKGGTGRSMHLANVAWILASNGQRVLAVDWDLEAPGLHRYFRPFLVDKELVATDGLIDMMWDFADAAMTPVPEAERAQGWHDDYADLLRCTAAVRWHWPGAGRLDLLPAGRQTPMYSRRVNSFNWQNFYDRLGGGVFLESVKDRMRAEYDYILIDSRTGVSDTAGICTVQMPDALVLCFTANNQSIEGCASIARSVREQWEADPQRGADRRRILPLLTRVDVSEKDKLNARRALARTRFDPYVAALACASVDDYWRDTEVSYVPWYSYEEVIAAFADKYKEKISILDAAEAITRVITHGEISSLARPNDEERERVLGEFTAGGDAAADPAPRRVSQTLAASPYPGPRPFTTVDAPMFFGRQGEIEHLVGRLRGGERELYVMGPSGCGKTSLVCAGLIPTLEQSPERAGARFLIRLVHPGPRPYASLAAVFERGTPLDVNDVHTAVDALLAHHADCERLLIAIDQLEELFAIADGVERVRFIDAAHALRGDPRVALLLVLRSDHHRALMESRLYEGFETRGEPMHIEPLRGDTLREAIAGPARALGVRTEPALIERLIADLDEQPGCLPLLQVILSGLWSSWRGPVLTAAHYTKIGGLQGIADYAALVCSKLVRVEEATALAMLVRLVGFGEGRRDTRRQQPRSAMVSAGASVAAFEAVLEHLIENRLVTVAADQHGEVVIDLAHEALISIWPAFAGWVQGWRVHEQRRRELEEAATAWRESGSGGWGLLRGEAIATARDWRDKALQLGQSADLKALIAASEAAHVRSHHRQRQMTQLVLVGIALVISTTALTTRALMRWHGAEIVQQIEDDQRRAQPSEAPLYQETARQFLLEDQRPLRALPYLVGAWAANPDGTLGASLRLLLGEAARHLPIAKLKHAKVVSSAAFRSDGMLVVTTSNDVTALVWNLTSSNLEPQPLAHADIVSGATFSPDGDRIVTYGRTARVWTLTTGTSIPLPVMPGEVIRTAVFSPDGTRIVTASDRWGARVWDATTGDAMHSPLMHRGVVHSAAFSPNGALIVTAAEDWTARIWDAAAGRPLSQPLGHRGAVTSAAFSADGTRVVTASADRTAVVWDVTTGKAIVSPLAHAGPVNSAAFSADGRWVVTASTDWTARIWEAASGKPIATLSHGGPVHSAAFSGDGERVVTTSGDSTARVWETATGKPLSPPLEHLAAVNSATFSGDGNRIVTVSQEMTAYVWNVTPGGIGAPLTHQLRVSSASFSADGTRVVSSSDDRTARVWSVGTRKLISPPLEHDGEVSSAAFSRDGRYVVTASRDRTARVWNLDDNTIPAQLKHADSVVGANFSLDGTYVVTASLDGTARVWRTDNGTPVAGFIHNGPVNAAVFSPQSAYVATASSDRTARVWVTTGGSLSPPLLHRGSVVSAAFSPDGAYLVTASQDQTARIWEIATGNSLCAPLTHYAAVSSAEFSPDGSRVVTASEDHTARIWDARTCSLIATAVGHEDAVLTASFSPDGTCVVTASTDHTVRVWDAVTGKPLIAPLQHNAGVLSAAFSRDGRRIVSASDDRTARIWELPLISGSLDEWETIARHTSPYVLRHGVLTKMSTTATASRENDRAWQ
jgi:WD40 repeat protein/MinD-like ATPase involved in chromosome partitioning or flagellar assembly